MIDLPRVLIGPKDRLKANLNNIKVFDDKSYGFDYQEHLLRKVFNEMGSEIFLFLIYEDFHKSIGFAEDKIYPRDKEYAKEKKTLSEIDNKQSGKSFMKNKRIRITKSLHWEPILKYYCNHEYWKIEYKKYIKTLEYYQKVFYNFDYCHVKDYENWNNWL
jgi:hypothetical protein